MTDHPYVDMSWWYQVLLAFTHRLAGVRGLVVLHTALVLGIFSTWAPFMTARAAPEEARSCYRILLEDEPENRIARERVMAPPALIQRTDG